MKKRKKNKGFLIITIVGIILLIIGTVILINKDDILKDNSNKKSELLEYKYSGNYTNDHLVVSDGKKYGYVNSSGKVIFPLENNLSDIITEDYDLDDYYFVDGLAKYYKDGVYGIIDSNGNIKVDARFGDVEIYSKDVIIIGETFGSYILDSSFSSYFNDTYIQILANKLDLEHFIAENDSFKYGIIDKENKAVIDFKYDNISYFNSGDESNFIYLAQLGDKIDIYTKDFKKLDISNISMVYWLKDNIFSYLDSSNRVHIYDITSNKDEVYAEEYNFVYFYTDDLAMVSNSSGKYGYINSSKDEVVSLKYNYSATEFINGYASVCNASDSGIDCGVIDKTGNEVISLKYDDIYVLGNDNFVVKDGDNFYIVDTSDKKLTSEYSDIDIIESGKYFIVSDKEGKVGILDSNYKAFEELEYTDIKYNEGVFTLRVDNGFYLLKV